MAKLSKSKTKSKKGKKKGDGLTPGAKAGIAVACIIVVAGAIVGTLYALGIIGGNSSSSGGGEPTRNGKYCVFFYDGLCRTDVRGCMAEDLKLSREEAPGAPYAQVEFPLASLPEIEQIAGQWWQNRQGNFAYMWKFAPQEVYNNVAKAMLEGANASETDTFVLQEFRPGEVRLLMLRGPLPVDFTTDLVPVENPVSPIPNPEWEPSRLAVIGTENFFADDSNYADYPDATDMCPLYGVNGFIVPPEPSGPFDGSIACTENFMTATNTRRVCKQVLSCFVSTFAAGTAIIPEEIANKYPGLDVLNGPNAVYTPQLSTEDRHNFALEIMTYFEDRGNAILFDISGNVGGDDVSSFFLQVTNNENIFQQNFEFPVPIVMYTFAAFMAAGTSYTPTICDGAPPLPTGSPMP
jgi:hypothetical protein